MLYCSYTQPQDILAIVSLFPEFYDLYSILLNVLLKNQSSIRSVIGIHPLTLCGLHCKNTSSYKMPSKMPESLARHILKRRIWATKIVSIRLKLSIKDSLSPAQDLQVLCKSICFLHCICLSV